MTTWRRGSSAAVRSLITAIRDTPWSWQETDVAELCRRMGWTLLEAIDGKGAFADAVDEGVAVLGEPTGRQHTEPPTVRWHLEDSTVLVRNLESAVTVTWASNRFQDDWDRIAEALE